MATDLSSLRWAGVPAVDFSPLGNLLKTYRDARIQGDTDRALSQIDPNNPQSLNTIGAMLMKAGNIPGGTAVQGLLNNQRDYNLRERQFNEGVRQFNVGAEGQRTPQGFEPDPNKPGALRPRPGGPTDPAYIADTRRGPQLSVSDITKLSEEGGKFSNLTGFMQGFRPEYGGKPFGIGEASNWVAKNMPSALTGETERNAADWWSSYQSYKNVVRNDLFGSALTVTEKAEFEKADINPGMNPELIVRNLKRQSEIVQRGIARKAGALVQAGHDPQVISKAYGMTPEQLGVPAKRGAAPAGPTRINSQKERDALPTGTQYIAPDETLRTKQ